jgi:hypothetical protein
MKHEPMNGAMSVAQARHRIATDAKTLRYPRELLAREPIPVPPIFIALATAANRVHRDVHDALAGAQP